MDENRPHRGDCPESGSPACLDRLLDRKVERRALPESFSTNLGWKRSSAERKVSDRSVRDMVSWFEKSTTTPDNIRLHRPRLASDSSSKTKVGVEKEGSQVDCGSNADRIHPIKWPQVSRQKEDRPFFSRTKTPTMAPSAQPGYEVEDYSLTLLKHKAYFNNRPLGRCLDAVEDDTKTKVQRVKSEEETAKETVTENEEATKNESGLGQKGKSGIAPPDREGTSSPIQQLDNLMSELLSFQESLESNTPTTDEKREKRDPAEVNRFWGEVRRQLWIDDDEIYGSEDDESPALPMPSAEVSKEARESRTTEPSESASSFPVSYSSEPAAKPPAPPMPTRPPPPVPAVSSERATSVTTLHRTQPSTSSLEPFLNSPGDLLACHEPSSTSSMGLTMTAPGDPAVTKPSFNDYFGPELPALPAPGRPLPVPPTQPVHSRYPSSNSSSGPWTRPPTWRTPSSLRSSSPPPVPQLPTPIPTPEQLNFHGHRRVSHSRNRHPYHPSITSTATSFSTTYSVAVTDNSGVASASVNGSRSVHNNSGSIHRGTRTLQASTSSTTTRSTRAGSSGINATTDLVDGPSNPPYQQPLPQPLPRAPMRRRMTAEEKLSEIDAFLSDAGEREGEGGGSEMEGREGWI